MKYQITPAGFVNVESGHHSGPPMMAETMPATAEDAFHPDTTKDIIVISLENDFKKAANDILEARGAKGEPAIEQFGLWIHDARKLFIQLLFNLASCGDKHAAKICEMLPEIADKVREEG